MLHAVVDESFTVSGWLLPAWGSLLGKIYNGLVSDLNRARDKPVSGFHCWVWDESGGLTH
jgi:hypothetical protein